MRIRDAVVADIPAITAIYAHHVRHGTGSFEDEPPSEAAMAVRFTKIAHAGWAWLAAEVDGEVVGFTYFSQIRDRTCFRHAAEDSLYVRSDMRGMGLGKSLLRALLPRAEAANFRQMVAVIGDSQNTGSIRAHLAMGFRQVGFLKSVGIKNGRWLDVVYMQRPLGVGDWTIPG